jgi:ribulose bisphosphate carboxylase small subunit
MSTHNNAEIYLNAQHEQHELEVELYHEAMAEKVTQFHEQGFLWVGSELYDLDRAQEAIWQSDEYSEHFTAKQKAEGAELEKLAREYKGLYESLLHRSIEDIADKAIEAEKAEAESDVEEAA